MSIFDDFEDVVVNGYQGGTVSVPSVEGVELPTDKRFLAFFLEDKDEVPFAKGKRFERTHRFLARCMELGCTSEQAYAAVWQFAPALDKEHDPNQEGSPGWIERNFSYEMSKIQAIHNHEGKSCRDALCPNMPRDDREQVTLAKALTPKPAKSRAVNLNAYLDGTYKAPEPSVGGMRNDGEYLLYAGKWHTVIAPTESGKSWLAVFHAKEVMLAGGIVVYLHFEESDAGGTVGRLLDMGLTAEMIKAQFIWLDCNEPWTKEEFAYEMELHKPALVTLDGINEACNMHGWDVEKIQGVGGYRKTFVSSAVSSGSAVLSLGHPVKDKTRQGERHGFGSSAWLDTVDGVGFRMVPSKEPIGRGKRGFTNLYSVKDRYGNVAKSGTASDETEGWVYLGALLVDDTRDQFDQTQVTVTEPIKKTITKTDKVDVLVTEIVKCLEAVEDHSYGSNKKLEEMLHGRRVSFDKSDLPKALARLETDNRIERADADGNKARPGHLRVP